jgi:uncharacterized protein YbjT (DUF2867 family)
MRTQLVAARSVAEALADLATDPAAVPGPMLEIAGPREESMTDAARALMAKRGEPVRIEGVAWDDRYAQGAALPGPDATLAGPTYEEWLAAARRCSPAAGRVSACARSALAAARAAGPRAS